ncbi:type II secretion system minor pseudopilin GspJ [Thalassotalea sp. LPB0316]|uniref:type II secretion system minor pseudopilin GspJ n=1 Tax=Thalassotalea sp. LPB0316 TaxID=2769490 RepID=UPI001868C65D|nr:type II secretion system minor pseudopilin GspJ [Thalassotalea sp. LPB0316]QOL26593.1 type II secretion system minor pseudopilin GspJ [Thalassotalea sp. LPB0316]
MKLAYYQSTGQAQRRGQRGFTLLELLLAMAIFALVSLAGLSVFDTVRNSDELTKRSLKELNQLQTLFLLMERDFTQIARRHVRLDGNESSENFIHTQSLNFASQTDAIAFVRHGWTNPNLVIARSSLQSVAYRVENSTLERLYFNHVDAVPGEVPKVRQLLSDVSDLRFKFYYQNKWQESAPKGSLPKAIEVEIVSEQLGTISRKFLVAGDESSTSSGEDN